MVNRDVITAKISNIQKSLDRLKEKRGVEEDIREIMRSMVGFRNLIVHEYAGLDTNKIYDIFKNKLGDFNKYLKAISIYAKL